MTTSLSAGRERSPREAEGDGTQRPPMAVGFVSGSAVEAVCETLAALGIEPDRALAQSGIDPFGPGPADPISFAALGRLMAVAEHRSGCPHIGLLAGQRTSLASLGELGLLMRHSDTLGDALRTLERHQGLFDRGAVVDVGVSGSVAIASYAPYEPDADGIALHCERALTALTTVMRALQDADWAPDEVLVPRRQPPDAKPYAEFFRAPVRFEQEIAALVFPATLLDRRIGGANPVLRRIAERRLRRFEGGDLTEVLRRHLRSTLIRGRLSAQQAAETMAVHRRTLSRRLKAAGTCYRSVANETRLAVARQLLADTDLGLAEIASALEFSEPAAFTHAFRRWTGTTPSAWRRDRRSPVTVAERFAPGQGGEAP
ncbi:AraC family transcriptional regulator [Methylobacterium sp. SyP6R]|uniref:AraC family transcriptional regulator n=1 Tax=Methylobacterium sp. SyP6R TaxID=2718876 RepID=UPI001F1AD9C5|nr:AraC family transcriptional regulator [Methylobacterium sp. SyP6R]MCF4129848.1 AraC family transcriptional regulator [Methylobacterium sp. SyP6R]